MKNFKEFEVQYKEKDGNGIIEGYASTWIQKPDAYGDIVKKGAFKNSLENRWNGGKGIPLLLSHRLDDIHAFIGTAEADEDEKGLHFIAKLDDTPEAQRARQLYKDGRMSRFSFAYDVLDAGPVELEDGTKANELRELDIFEISCVLIPANDDAQVVGVKAGKRNSKSDESKIKQAIGLLQDVLGEAEGDEPAKEEEPKGNGAPEDLNALNEAKAANLEYINKYKN